MSSWARTAGSSLRMVSRRAPRQSGVRFITEVRNDSGHGALPFRYNNKRSFTAKYLAFLGLGTALPFVATYWQLRKSSGSSA
ncbi:hypothetical protein C8Q75DRAFT_756452 [Abortiporus biennis]|nr:hypothetical protein C8Q75DRAFT_756452 [Abortiporus biennis]